MALETWDAPRRARRPPLAVVTPKAGEISIEAAVEGMIRARRLATTTAKVVRWNLVGGRFKLYCQKHQITAARALTAAVVEAFLAGIEPSVQAVTAAKYRQHFRWLLTYLHDQGVEVGTLGPGPRRDDRLAVSDEPPLTVDEARRLVEAAKPGRDRVIVELMLSTGIRPSELCALRLDHVRLDRQPPYVEIRGSVHDPERTKSRAGQRDVPLDTGGRPLSRHMKAYIEKDREKDAATMALFLSGRRDRFGQWQPLTQGGLQTMLDRLGERTGIHCNPYRFRHTLCSWLADAGLPAFQLMTLMGWSSVRMVERYYRRRNQLALEAATKIRLS